MSNNMGHPLDGETSDCTQVTVEIARPGRRPITKSITVVESIGGGPLDLTAISEVVEDTARHAVREAYCNGRSAT